MLPRLAEPPRALLGVSPEAAPEALRAAFLRLTKQFHPQKFARYSPDVVRLANEVFLTIKRAYDQSRNATGRAGSPASRAANVPAPPPPPPPSARDRAFEDAQELLRRRRWGDARQAFQTLAIARPQDRRCRAHMHYARGREASEAGRPDEARAELQRALALDPTFRAARAALDELPPPGGERLSTIFRRP